MPQHGETAAVWEHTQHKPYLKRRRDLLSVLQCHTVTGHSLPSRAAASGGGLRKILHKLYELHATGVVKGPRNDRASS
jgi:hypothetical protein